MEPPLQRPQAAPALNPVNVAVGGSQTQMTARAAAQPGLAQPAMTMPAPAGYQQQLPPQQQPAFSAAPKPAARQSASERFGMPMPSQPAGLMFPRSPPSLLEKAESNAAWLLKMSSPVIRPVARLFMICTFLEDTIRMATQWKVQADHVSSEWQAEPWVGDSFVAFNLICQLVPCIILLLYGFCNISKTLVQFCLALLIFVVLAQSVAYHVLWNMEFFLRNLAVIGALCMVGAEAADPEPAKGGILDRGMDEIDEDDDAGDILRLSGRVMLSLMFITLIKFDTTARIILEGVAGGLLLLVVIGYKTKLSAVTLVIFLFLENLIINDFFIHSPDENIHDFKKFNFFQSLTVIGGLMMLVSLGPGTVSIDGEQKKDR